jgi:hypothetical protein
MTPNIGTADRIVRLLAGLGLLSLFFVLDGPARWFGLVGLVPLLTAGVRFCPLYTVLGIRTCRV